MHNLYPSYNVTGSHSLPVSGHTHIPCVEFLRTQACAEFLRVLASLYINTLVRTYVCSSRFKGQLVMRMHVTRGNMQIQSKEGRADQVSSYGLDSQ